MNDNQFINKISGYKISAYGLNLYCKITEVGRFPYFYNCTLSFGTGMKKFCVVAAYNMKKPYEIYIDRVEKNDKCVLDDNLSSYSEGTAKFFKAALWTLKRMYPHVLQYTLRDDSNFPCNGNAESSDTMPMACDYIVKYNQTWYQKKFGAVLPDSANSNSLWTKYNNSLVNLDQQLPHFLSIRDRIPNADDYKEEYEAAKSPREFINSLREKLKKRYCNIVGKWLAGYIHSLGINIFYDSWYIPHEAIVEPEGFSITKLTNNNAKRILTGGKIVKHGVFNDNPQGKRRKLRLGYGTAKRARNSIKKLRRYPDKQYKIQAAHTLYYRAKMHKYQTPGMREAAKIYKKFLQTLKQNN